MKRNLVLLFVGALMVMACQQNQIDVQQMEDDVFYAAIENDDQTRTTLDENNNVMWSANDQLTIFKKSSINSKYQVASSSAGKTTGTFTKVYAGNDDEFTAGGELDHNVAVYPYQEQLAVSRADDADLASRYEIEGMVLPEEQEYVANSFAEGAFPMAAVSLNNELVFRNVCGGIKFQLKGTQKVTSIKIKGNDKEKLAGNAVLTVYADEDLKPALTMASDAVKSVTLDCGDGVQLTESSATEFIIALPPVLFSKGFTATVTASDGQTYTVQTDKANTVLRSSLLVMPVFDLNKGPESGEDEDAIYVEYLILSNDHLNLYPGTSFTLGVEMDPIEVTDPTLTWVSDDTSIVEVDQNGKVTAKADGNAIITVMAVGGVTAECEVRVREATAVASVDYVDEYGINHGRGIVIGDFVYAPVNCGYKAATADDDGYPYGKLYQWGRRYGQGYDGPFYVDDYQEGTFSDASYPEGEDLIEAPVKPSWGSSAAYEDSFFYGKLDWSDMQIDDMWGHLGDKTAKDPCPSGWRVPSEYEFFILSNHSSWTSVDGQEGYWFTGWYTYMDDINRIFLPAGGYRNRGGNAANRNSIGRYWTRDSKEEYAYYFNIQSFQLSIRKDGCRAEGYSVRCVQE